MSFFQRIKNILAGVGLLLLAVIFLAAPAQAYSLIPLLLAIVMMGYGLGMMWYYFTMARHMVGGKAVLCRAVIVTDLGMLTASASSMSSLVVLIYLLSIFAVTGFLDIGRAIEAMSHGSRRWKGKLISGVISVLFSAALVIFGLFGGSTELLAWGFCGSLVYLAVQRFIAAFRRTSIVFIR